MLFTTLGMVTEEFLEVACLLDKVDFTVGNDDEIILCENRN